MATAANADAIATIHARRTRSAQVDLLNAICTTPYLFFISDRENDIAKR
jgi:hypothetical protein